jgi:hypothetical protein
LISIAARSFHLFEDRRVPQDDPRERGGEGAVDFELNDNWFVDDEICCRIDLIHSVKVDEKRLSNLELHTKKRI